MSNLVPCPNGSKCGSANHRPNSAAYQVCLQRATVSRNQPLSTPVVPHPVPTVKTIGDYADNYVEPSDLGLDDWGVTSVYIFSGSDTNTISIETEFDLEFCASHFVGDDVSEDVAEAFLTRSMDGDLESLISEMYSNAELNTYGSDSVTIDFDLEVDAKSSLEDAGRTALYETGLEDLYNEFIPEPFSRIDLNQAIRELALTKGGGEVRDLQDFDNLLVPTQEDNEEAYASVFGEGFREDTLGWETLMGDTPRTPDNYRDYEELRDEAELEYERSGDLVDERALDIAERRQLERAAERNIAIPADLEDAINEAALERHIDRAGSKEWRENYVELTPRDVAQVKKSVEAERRRKVDRILRKYTR